jgi:hypothetical protein
MSVKAMTWVFENSPYTLGSRLVHLALADWANDDNDGLIWASQPRIAAKAKVSVPTVASAIKKMLDDGYLIEVESGPGRTSVYRFITTPQKSEGCETPQEDEGVPLKTAESVLSLTQKKLKAGAAVDQHPSDYGFERWWDRYPQRNGKRGSKAKALGVWKKLTYQQKAEAWRQLGEYVRIVAAGRPPMDADRWLRLGNESKWDPAEGWNAGDVQSPSPGTSGPGIGPARKPWAHMTDGELAAVWPSLSEGERTEAEGARRQAEIARRRAAGA